MNLADAQGVITLRAKKLFAVLAQPVFTGNPISVYSDFRLLTGLAMATRMAW